MMKKVKVIAPYYDKERKEYPELNSEFEVEEKRAAFLFDVPPNLEYHQTESGFINSIRLKKIVKEVRNGIDK